MVQPAQWLIPHYVAVRIYNVIAELAVNLSLNEYVTQAIGKPMMCIQCFR